MNAKRHFLHVYPASGRRYQHTEEVRRSYRSKLATLALRIAIACAIGVAIGLLFGFAL